MTDSLLSCLSHKMYSSINTGNIFVWLVKYLVQHYHGVRVLRICEDLTISVFREWWVRLERDFRICPVKHCSIYLRQKMTLGIEMREQTSGNTKIIPRMFIKGCPRDTDYNLVKWGEKESGSAYNPDRDSRRISRFNLQRSRPLFLFTSKLILAVNPGRDIHRCLALGGRFSGKWVN